MFFATLAKYMSEFLEQPLIDYEDYLCRLELSET